MLPLHISCTEKKRSFSGSSELLIQSKSIVILKHFLRNSPHSNRNDVQVFPLEIVGPYWVSVNLALYWESWSLPFMFVLVFYIFIYIRICVCFCNRICIGKLGLKLRKLISSICRLGSLPCARTFQFILQFPQKERAVSRYRTIRCTHISLSDNPFYILWVFLFQISNNLYLIKILNNNNNTPSSASGFF